MSRFTEFKYDEKQWELRVEEKLDKQYDDDVGHIKKYYLRNLSTNKEYRVLKSVHWDVLASDNTYAGLEQIDDNRILLFYQDEFSCRLAVWSGCSSGCGSLSYAVWGSLSYEGKRLVSLNSDKIWLGNWKVYSIRENCLIETLKPFQYYNTEITQKTDSNGNDFLHIKLTLESKENDNEIDYLLFVFDTEKFMPAFPVYSSLRDSYIKLSDSFTVTDLIEEEVKYKDLVSLHMKSITEEVPLFGLVDKT